MSTVRWIVLCTFLLIHQGSAQFLDENCISFNPYDGSSSSPWLAEIRTPFKLICSGTLITNQYVLTAASCIKNKRQIVVHLGNNDGDSFQSFPVKKVYIHRSYSEITKDNNIGLIKLDAVVEYSANIRPICITKNPLGQSKDFTFEKFNKKPEIGDWCKFKSYFGEACVEEIREKYLASKLIGSPWKKKILYGPLQRYVQHGILSYRNAETYVDTYTNVFAYVEGIASLVLDVAIFIPNSLQEH
ncbi:thrombin-like enzyme CPI-enzyme 2 [Drosophila subpulchrella]|uniref:thrombin-like enzyme CPI-enzyme 2 n=1 Tax=Drosophila subpulchrella TaxID=1486046 RepID=UPI0018A144C1|nr:thrombin-like enzyme CPI-enzyme 2 [Drosophila subpulchrella]